MPLAASAARRARFETLLGGLSSYFSQAGAAAFLLFIVLYKLGDAFDGALLTPFLLKGMAYASAEVGVVNKLIGLWLTIAGALLGGAAMLRLGLWRSLMLFGVLQMASNIGFWWLAQGGKGQLGVAVEVLKEFDLLDQVPVVGLAMQREEIFLPSRRTSILLPRDSHLRPRHRNRRHDPRPARPAFRQDPHWR